VDADAASDASKTTEMRIGQHIENWVRQHGPAAAAQRTVMPTAAFLAPIGDVSPARTSVLVKVQTSIC
jgi:hypothetical protein